MNDWDFNSLFTTDKPVIFKLPRLPLADSQAGVSPLEAGAHPRAGLQGRGHINTPLELAILNQIDRFNLVIDVIDRVPKLGSARRPM